MKKIVIKYFASWCGPCKIYGPIFDKVVSELGDEFEIKNIDIEDDPEGLSVKHKVRGIPHTVIMQGDDVIASRSGMMREDQLREFLNK